MIFNKAKRLLNGFSYIEIIISMMLISIFILGMSNIFFVAKKKYNFVQENYFADVTLDNLFNAAKSEFDLNKSILNIDPDEKYFYHNKFNFVMRLSQFDNDLFIEDNNYEIINTDNENVFPLETEIIDCDNSYLFSNINETYGNQNYLLTIDLFDKKHNFLKRFISLI